MTIWLSLKDGPGEVIGGGGLFCKSDFLGGGLIKGGLVRR